jgi:hypothetical protein
MIAEVTPRKCHLRPKEGDKWPDSLPWQLRSELAQGPEETLALNNCGTSLAGAMSEVVVPDFLRDLSAFCQKTKTVNKALFRRVCMVNEIVQQPSG